MKILNLIFCADKEIVSVVKDVSSEWTHFFGTINITIERVTNTPTGFITVPLRIPEELQVITKIFRCVIVPGGAIPQVVNILASTMPRAIIGARHSLTAFPFITIKT